MLLIRCVIANVCVCTRAILSFWSRISRKTQKQIGSQYDTQEPNSQKQG